jgi:A118 family predicted phage portal protein
MPLPAGGNTPWPPKAVAVAYEKFVPWAAWYSGDPDELAAFYMQVSQRVTNRPHARPSQYRGGMVGTLARWFWGQPIPQGEKRSKVHLPLAGDIASTSADLLFAEPPNVMLPENAGPDTNAQDYLDQLVDDEFYTALLEGAEVGSALGGVYFRVIWDKTLSDKPWINAIHADAAVPEWRFGRLSAVTFWRVLSTDASTVVRHLERYEMVNGQAVWQQAVYQGDAMNLGRVQPLGDYPETENFVDMLEADGQTVLLGIDQLPVVYVPNMRPNRMWRDQPAAAHFGRSDYAGIEGLFDALDETMSSWMRDIRLAKGRVLVPDQYLRDRGPGRGAQWDAEQEAYEGFSMLPGQPPQITIQQFGIRVAEHSQSVQELMTMAVGMAGYSGQTFGLTGEVAMTATEVAAKERKSLITRKKKLAYFRPPLTDLFEILLKVGKAAFEWDVTPLRPDVEFGDVVQQDPNALATTLQALRLAEAASTQTMVEMLHPDWTADEQKNEVKRIMHEKGMVVANPDTVGTPGGLPTAAGSEVDTDTDEDIPVWVPHYVDQLPAPDVFAEGLTPAEPPVISPAAYVGQ